MRAITLAAATALTGVLFFLTPAQANEVWDFTGTNTALGQSHNYTGNLGDIINAQAFGPNGSGLGLPGPVQLFGKANTGSETDENGAGLTNDPSGDNEITVGSFIQLDLFNILPSLTSLTKSFTANSTTSGETWQVWGTNTAGTLGSGTIPGGTLLDSCTSVGGPGDPCEAVRNIAGAGAFRYLDVTAFGDASNVLLHTVDAAVPGPIVGAGLPGLVATCGGLLGLARRRRRKQIA